MLWFCSSSFPSFRFLSCILSLASALCARSGSWQRDPAGHGTQQRALREGEREELLDRALGEAALDKGLKVKTLLLVQVILTRALAA